MDQWREKVVGLAQSHLGVPYIPRCLIPELGLDCGTLLYFVYREVIKLPAFPATYSADWALHTEDNRYLDWIKPFIVQISRPIRGGISVWKYGRSFSHGAIVVDKHHVIHAWGRSSFGCVQKSHTNLFKIGQEQREVKHFDLRPECR